MLAKLIARDEDGSPAAFHALLDELLMARSPTGSSHVRVACVYTGAPQVPFESESPSYSGRSESAKRGTTNDARKIGKNLFPVHRKATT